MFVHIVEVKNSSCIWLKLAMASAAMTVCGPKTEKKLINGTIMYIRVTKVVADHGSEFSG